MTYIDRIKNLCFALLLVTLIPRADALVTQRAA